MIIIGIIGKANAGKSTISNHIREKFTENFPDLYVLQKSFSSPLKKMLLDTKICTEEELYERKTPFSRRMMQAVGTDIVRTVAPDYWCNKMEEELYQIYLAKPYSIVIIDDLRFRNEKQLLQKLKGYFVKITRSGLKSDDYHRSETELDDMIGFDELIQNNGTLSQLERVVKNNYFLNLLVDKIKQDFTFSPTTKSCFLNGNNEAEYYGYN